MKLVKACVYRFRSINEPQTIDIDEKVTVLVGMNEAGKTVFLKALNKSRDATVGDKFEPIEDYPRRLLSGYMKKHKEDPDNATTLTYRLEGDEAERINTQLGTKLSPHLTFSVTRRFDNSQSIDLSVDEAPALQFLAKSEGLSSDAANAITSAKSLRAVLTTLDSISLTEADKAFQQNLAARLQKVPNNWNNAVGWEVWRLLEPQVPRFLYFSDYDLLPGKLNLTDLASRQAQAKADPNNGDTFLKAQHKAVLALLRMADVDVTDFNGATGYEEMKAKIEGVSISLTDQILEFWKQNEELDVEVDIKQDAKDEAPYNNGPNLYLRIRNQRHRGVSTPFDQRSRGFIWFFSFLVWFDSVREQLNAAAVGQTPNLVLLLDEPGLALHALAQADFLNYIDKLAENHQVLYTTHSPFMVHSDRLDQVRIVEDKEKVGTTLSSTLTGSDPRTVFPLQAALGWTLAQNLFISKRNLLVEGPSELAYLQLFSAFLEQCGLTGLRDDVTIVPVGGLSNVTTFVSLLGASGLKLAVLHDFSGKSDQKLDVLVKQKLLASKSIVNASQFRYLDKLNEDTVPTDIEDLLDVDLYLDYFNQTFAVQLKGHTVKEADLPPGDRIVHRIEKYLASEGIKIKSSGGFNHYAVAAKFLANPPANVSSDSKERFGAMFEALNKLL